jgi:hypothetical protein
MAWPRVMLVRRSGVPSQLLGSSEKNLMFFSAPSKYASSMRISYTFSFIFSRSLNHSS